MPKDTEIEKVLKKIGKGGFFSPSLPLLFRVRLAYETLTQTQPLCVVCIFNYEWTEFYLNLSSVRSKDKIRGEF